MAFIPLYSQPAVADAAPNPTFANYGFASELRSGVDSTGGRTVEIYQIPLKFSFREASPQGATPGINFVVPFTLGFFNFQTKDVAQLKVPNQIGELSVEPGVELDYWLSDVWHVCVTRLASALGIARRALQFETGVMLGVSPMWQIHGITLPRIDSSGHLRERFRGTVPDRWLRGPQPRWCQRARRGGVCSGTCVESDCWSVGSVPM